MEISEFRARMRDYVVGDQSTLDDEEWWTQTTELSLLVLAERARVKRERGLANPVYRAWQAQKAQSPDVEAHRFSFEGSTTLLADHLTGEHGLPPNAVNRWRGGLSQGDWVALGQLHHAAHTVSKES